MLMQSASLEPAASFPRGIPGGPRSSRPEAVDPEQRRRWRVELQAIVGALGEAASARWTVQDGAMVAEAELIGRESQLADLVDRIRADAPVAVVGEAGIGKTALVRAAAAAAGRTIHEGGGFATLSWLPYLALRRATGLTETGDPGLVAGLVERAVGPDVLFVDDLQWTDDDTRAVIQLLLGRIAIVVAIREGDERAAPTLQQFRATGATVIRLDGLGDEASGALAARLRPEMPAAGLRRVVDLAGGNPLLIEELVLHGQTSPSLARAIVGQLATLTEGDRDAMELIALAGRPLPALAVGSAARGLLERSLVRAVADDIEVRHSLIAEAIVDQLEGDRRRELHGRLGDIVVVPSERARHLAAAGRPAEAFDVALAALATETDPRTRAVLLTIAAETSPDDADGFRVQAGAVLLAIGNTAEAIDLLQAPIEGDDATQAAGAAALAGALNNEARWDEAWQVIEAARRLRPAPSSRGALELVATEASLLVNAGRLAEAIKVVEAAHGAALTADATYRLAAHLAALRLYAGEADKLPELEASVAAAVAAADGGTAAGRSMDLYYMTMALRGGRAAVEVALTSAGQLAGLGYHTRATELLAEGTQAALFAGELSNTVIRADSLLEEPLGALSRQRLAYNRGFALALLGHVEEAERTLSATEKVATNDFDGRGATLWCWAEACLWGGQPDRALAMAHASLELTAFNEAEYVLPSLARAWAEVELGRDLTPVEFHAPFPFFTGAAPELRGLQARARGDHAEAAVAFDEAAEGWSGFHEPRAILCRWAAGDSLLQAGDRTGAVEWLRAAETAAAAIGFEPLAARARRSLRLAGERSGRPRATDGSPGLLTRREREVLALVERGLTNAEIARRMSLGRPTVARLLSNAMLKLGAESRAQAVVLAAQTPAFSRESGAIER